MCVTLFGVVSEMRVSDQKIELTDSDVSSV